MQSNLQNSATSTTHSNRCSDEVMRQQQGLDDTKRTSLAAEVVSDCSPRTSEEMDDATRLSKEPSEEREITDLLHSGDLAADKKSGLCPYKVHETIIL